MSSISLRQGDQGAGGAEADSGDTLLHLASVVDKMEIRDREHAPPS